MLGESAYLRSWCGLGGVFVFFLSFFWGGVPCRGVIRSGARFGFRVTSAGRVVISFSIIVCGSEITSGSCGFSAGLCLGGGWVIFIKV